MEAFIFPLIATVAGGYFLIRNAIYLKNENKLREYVESSPKAKFWVNKYGVEETILHTKRHFLPLGIFVSCGLLGVGLWNLLILVKTNA